MPARSATRNSSGSRNRAVDQAIAKQEAVGLDVVNDGELRRFSFLDHLLGEMEGVADIPGATIRFHAADPAQDWEWQPPVTGRERLALSTQCGFSPVSIGGNLIGEDTQQRKLELVAEVARQVW